MNSIYKSGVSFKAFITNLNAYNNGVLLGRWLNFPTNINSFDRILSQINIDDFYNEWFSSDFIIYKDGIKHLLDPFCSFEELNEIANSLNEKSL